MRSPIHLLSFCLCLLLAGSALAAPAVPAWRGQAPGTAYLGPDVLWRTREGVVFNLLDEKGTGFTLTCTVRDMNTYMQGPRPACFWVVGPQGETLARTTLPDDGVTAGNDRYKDGIADVWMDFRYRAWHRLHSPGGYPAGKARSPFLTTPEQLAARTLTLTVPKAGKGLYRVVVLASWDHWVSITPDRPIMTGVHSGPGPLYVHGARLKDAYLYAPANVQDLGVSLSEEVAPFNWSMQLEDLQGKVLGATTPRTFFSYIVAKQIPGDAVYRLRVTGTTPGACLHIGGVPALLCPDAETARKLHGGMAIDAKGRVTFHAYQRTLNAWMDRLQAKDLAVPDLPVQPEGIADKALRDALKALPKALTEQTLDPQSPRFGAFTATTWSDTPANTLATIAGTADPGNPYYKHAGLIRRAVLSRLKEINRLSSYFWFEGDGPMTYDPKDAIFSVPFRSNWYPMHDAIHVYTLRPLREVIGAGVPKQVAAALQQAYTNWGLARTLITQGECSNQWCEVVSYVAKAYDFTRDPALLEILRDRVGVITSPQGLGRTDPDTYPAALNSAGGFTFAADTGMLGAGNLADGLGFDAEYGLEQVLYIRRTWEITQDPRLLEWWNKDYDLKTHLTLPKWGVHTAAPFTETCSPTDVNFRTQYYTHKDPLPEDARARVNYGDLWAGTPNPQRPWPCLEEGSFTRVIDNKFYFVKTPAYYGIAYGGPTQPEWTQFGVSTMKDGSADVLGYGGMHYGGFQRKSTKPGGLSAVWVPNCGPTLLSQNHDIMYTNTVWGRVKERVTPLWEEGQVDPTIIAAAYAQPVCTFDAHGRIYRRSEVVRYAPLLVDRVTQFKDDRIVVTLDVTATGDTDLTELYETLPYFVDKRGIRTFDAAFAPAAAFNPLGAKADGSEASMEQLTFRAVDIAAANGAGAAILFDKAYTFAQVAPYRYRDVAAFTRAFLLPLPTAMRAGQRVQVRYVIYPHATALTPDALARVAADEKL